jgi:uncharacterized protein
MLIGIALYRLKVLTGERSLRFYWIMAAGGYALGLAIRGGFEALQWSVGFEPLARVFWWRGLLYEVGRLPMTLGLVGLTVALYKSGALGMVAGWLKAIGRLALTNYIGQSIITSILFYALGYYGKFGFAQLMGIAALIWIAQGIFSVFWLRSFAMGPAEWLLRALTYGVAKPIRLSETAAAPSPAPAE